VAVSAPVRESDGRVVAAISISGPTARLTLKDLNRIGLLIVEKINEATTSPQNQMKHGKAGAA